MYVCACNVNFPIILQNTISFLNVSMVFTNFPQKNKWPNKLKKYEFIFNRDWSLFLMKSHVEKIYNNSLLAKLFSFSYI